MIYFIIALLFFLLSILFIISIPNASKTLLIIIFFILLLIFGGLRYQVGTDWYNYSIIYDYIDFSNVFDFNIIEPLFGILILFTKSIYYNYLWFIFFIFCLTTSLKIYSIYKYSNNFFASLLVYFPIQLMTYDFNGIRQGIAMGVIFCSIKYLLNRQLFSFLIIVLIATGFHYSALIFFPFYFISNIKISKKYINIIIISSFIIGYLFQNLFLLYFLPRLNGIGSIYTDKILSYSENESFGQVLSVGFSTFHRLFIFYIFYIFYNKIKLKDDFKNILLNSYLFSLIIYFLFSSIEILASRGSLYYRAFDIFIITSFITIRKEFSYKIIIICLIFIYCLWGIYTNLKIPSNGLVPYTNLLFKLN